MSGLDGLAVPCLTPFFIPGDRIQADAGHENSPLAAVGLYQQHMGLAAQQIANNTMRALLDAGLRARYAVDS